MDSMLFTFWISDPINDFLLSIKFLKIYFKHIPILNV